MVAQSDENLFFDSPDAQPYLDSRRRLGFEAHSLIADPLFVDPARGDYRLKPGSPALQAGVSSRSTSAGSARLRRSGSRGKGDWLRRPDRRALPNRVGATVPVPIPATDGRAQSVGQRATHLARCRWVLPAGER